MSNNKVYDIVTQQVVDLLEAGTVPWHKPWDPRVGLPVSLATRKAYRGLNPFILGVAAQAAGYSSPWWGTYDQVGKHGGQIRKGEHATLVTFWKTGKRDVETDGGGTKQKRYMILRYFKVFNLDQADWSENAKIPGVPGGHDHDPIDECERVIAHYLDNSGPRFTTVNDGAWYQPFADKVNVPPLAAHDTPEDYYSTAFHELTHSTGHASRLKREGVDGKGHRFGDEVYSKEELVAEMGAAMLAGICGIQQATIHRSAAYLASWIRTLKGDSSLIVSAAAAAQRAADLILDVKYADAETTDENKNELVAA